LTGGAQGASSGVQYEPLRTHLKSGRSMHASICGSIQIAYGMKVSMRPLSGKSACAITFATRGAGYPGWRSRAGFPQKHIPSRGLHFHIDVVVAVTETTKQPVSTRESCRPSRPVIKRQRLPFIRRTICQHQTVVKLYDSKTCAACMRDCSRSTATLRSPRHSANIR
jgi:hypothetical protein